MRVRMQKKKKEKARLVHLIVDGDAIWPANADVDQDGPVGAIQTGTLNTGVLAPLSPEQVSRHIRADLDD